jgi:hypothetical protein
VTTPLLRIVNGQQERYCRKCKDWWPNTSEFFYYNKARDGFRSPCKACIADKRAQTNEVTLCCVPGCTNPRYLSKGGKYQSRCWEHRLYAMKPCSHEVNMSAICTHPGCSSPRWLGPSGRNHKLVMCEEHQREDWRNRKAAKREAAPPKERQPRTAKPKREKRGDRTLTIDRRRGVLKVQQVSKLDTFKQLDMVVAAYREQGYKIVEKG